MSARAGATCESASTQDATGWFGKVPALGDFVHRRLPAAMRERWDAWLSAGMLAGERALGDGWTDAYLSFPVWRFIWLDVSPHGAWAGVLAPGADRVGRLFPVLIARRLGADVLARPSLDALDAWLDALEARLLALFDDDDVDAFDEALLALPPMPTAPVATRMDGDVATTAEPPARDGAFDWTSDGATPAEVAAAIALRALARAGQPVAWFWCRDADGVVRTRLHGGTPDPAWFVDLTRPAR